MIEEVGAFLEANLDTLEQAFAKSEWTKEEKEIFLAEFPYFFDRIYREREVIPEAITPEYLLAIAVGAIEAINSLKYKYKVPFEGFNATGGNIGWRTMYPTGEDLKVKAIDTSGQTPPVWVDYIGDYNTNQIMRLSDYHAVVFYGLNIGTVNAGKIDGYQFWDADKKEFYKYFPPAVISNAVEFGVLLLPEVRVFKVQQGFGLRLRVTVAENLGKIPPLGIVVGIVDQYLSKETPSW